ncbi:MAG: hypothetical protein IJ781_14865 [Atopobiaceae bacterium]|nr:hypothetical protein [Atopobiaceae bacterium]
MWELMQQLRRLFESTQLTTDEVAKALSEQTGRPIHGAEIRKAMNKDDALTRKERDVTILAHKYLTKEQERQNREIQTAIRRAASALGETES